jgi:hypothetical protein
MIFNFCSVKASVDNQLALVRGPVYQVSDYYIDLSNFTSLGNRNLSNRMKMVELPV